VTVRFWQQIGPRLVRRHLEPGPRADIVDQARRSQDRMWAGFERAGRRGVGARRRGHQGQIVFYASTPAYRGVLDLHGWSDLQPELTRLTKEGRWSELGSRIDDEMVRAFAVVGDPAAVARGLRQRYGDIATRITLYATYQSDPALWAEIVAGLR
jgi:alkanesulfonate monooxygenase SsuD/methylene tetrahydromethanopterin reductase-like flavin-dependent oxidoreductase (luciferase family)